MLILSRLRSSLPEALERAVEDEDELKFDLDPLSALSEAEIESDQSGTASVAERLMRSYSSSRSATDAVQLSSSTRKSVGNVDDSGPEGGEFAAVKPVEEKEKGDTTGDVKGGKAGKGKKKKD